ncbi:MAG: hypothetical protein AAGC55_03085 [Myxococcota bacterium]
MRNTVQALRDTLPRTLAALIERARTGTTTGRLWQVIFGENDTDEAEVLGPLGYAARPARRGAQALVVRAGNGTVSAVIALNDPDARVIPLAEDERAIYNDRTHFILRSDGRIDIGGHNRGVARMDDEVEVTIPFGTQLVDPNTGRTTTEITLFGTITSASDTVRTSG